MRFDKCTAMTEGDRCRPVVGDNKLVGRCGPFGDDSPRAVEETQPVFTQRD